MPVDYSMRISRLTVDKLGVKLYDKVSAVIAELIANAYDADATDVTVQAPMGQFLATRAGGTVSDKGFDIQVVDNGIGMTPWQVQEFFLVVGAERRSDANRGGLSPVLKRKVMGRKGVGKLAPFGICKTIEVISAGGNLINGGGSATTDIPIDYRLDTPYMDHACNMIGNALPCNFAEAVSRRCVEQLRKQPVNMSPTPSSQDRL